METYLRLKQIVSDVNLIMSTFESEQYLTEANAVLAHEEAKDAANEQATDVLEGNWGLREDDAFSPIKGNVAFGSAIDGWGFRIQQFAEMYAEKLGANVAALNKALWGDYHFQAKTKSVAKIKQGTGIKVQKPMFVQFILEPLYNVCVSPDPAAVPARHCGSRHTRLSMRMSITCQSWGKLSRDAISRRMRPDRCSQKTPSCHSRSVQWRSREMEGRVFLGCDVGMAPSF